MADLQFILDQIRKEKKSNLLVGPFIVAMAIFTAVAFYVERDSAGWAKTLFIWALCALFTAGGVSMFRDNLRPAEKDEGVILLTTAPEQIVWAHVQIVMKNGIHHASLLQLHTEAGKKLEVPLPPIKESSPRALALVSELAPRATLGYSPESEALFTKDPAALRRS